MATTIKVPNELKWALKWAGAQWAPKIISGLTSVDPDEVTDLADAQTKISYAVQHCDPDSGVIRVSGTLRGFIEKLVKATPNMAALGELITVLITFFSQFVPAESAD